MNLKMNIGGIDTSLDIRGFVHSENEFDYNWCKCDFSLHCGEWLDYDLKNDELLLSTEILSLIDALEKLLSDQLTVQAEFRCMEPDFLFLLNPKKDLREDPNYTYIAPGYEIEDITLEWRIYFWNEGLTENYLTLTLMRNEIMVLKSFLEQVAK